MSLVREVRVRLNQGRTQASKFLAAPDRWRRRRWAREWSAKQAVEGCATAPAALDREGFSPCRLAAPVSERLLRDWSALKATLPDGRAGGSGRKSTGKEFFDEALSEQGLRDFPAFLAIAIDEQVLTSVMRTMDMLPHLESVDLLVSVHTGKQLSASQLWHYDVNDERIVKLFVYLEDCWPRHGPFTFLAADDSRRVSGLLGHYVDDQRISALVPRERWRSVEGAAGTAFFIDTGRCYHFGSRSQETRYAYVVTYSSGLKFMRRSKIWGDILGPQVGGLSALQRAVCGL